MQARTMMSISPSSVLIICASSKWNMHTVPHGGLCVAVRICCVEVILCGPGTSARRAVTKYNIMERYRLNEPSSIGKVLDGGVGTDTTKPVCHNQLHHRYERSHAISMASYIFPISSQTKGLRFRISPTCTLSQNGYGNRFVYSIHKRFVAQLITSHCSFSGHFRPFRTPYQNTKSSSPPPSLHHLPSHKLPPATATPPPPPH